MYDTLLDESQGSPTIVVRDTATSPPLRLFDTRSYTFEKPGTYTHYDPVVSLIAGTIVVMP